MLRKLLTPIFMFFSSLAFANDGNYAIAIGEEDKDRLIILNEIYNPFAKVFFEKCHLIAGNRVLEIGCGIGLVSQQLASIVGESGFVLATDSNEQQLVVAKSLLQNETLSNLQFRQLSAYELDTLKEKFDVVYVRFLLCHLPNPEEIIRQVKSVLKPGGRFIIEDMMGNHTLSSKPLVKGMEILHYVDRLQFEIQQSDDQYFAKLPQLLKDEGFSILLSAKSHPKLDSYRKRKFLTYNLSSLKTTLLEASKITSQEYSSMYLKVQELENDLSVEVFSYELGQICATFDP